MHRLALAAVALIAMAAGLAKLSSSGNNVRPITAASAAGAVGSNEAVFGQLDPPATLPAPIPLPTPSNDDPSEPDVAKSPPRSVRIPAIEVEAAVIDLGLEPDGALETPDDYALAGWWAGGSTANLAGPAVIVGHVDDYHGPAVFFRLRELVVGDDIEVTDSTGVTTRFVVTETAIYDKDDFPTEKVYGSTDAPTLRLITCGGSFDRSVRSYEANVVVYAELQ